MLAATTVALAMALGQPQPPPGDAAARSAASAEKAAQAAQVAAEAAARAAAAAEKAAQAAQPTARARAEPAREGEGATAPGPGPWKATVAAGLTMAGGDTRLTTAVVQLDVERLGPEWILAARAGGLYGVGRPAGQGSTETLALSGELLLRADRRYGASTSAYALALLAADHLRAVETRAGLEMGTGIAWIDTRGPAGPGSFLRTDLGLRVERETRFEYYPVGAPLPAPVPLVAPRLGLVARTALGAGSFLAEEAQVLPSVSGFSRVLASSITRLVAHLAGPVQMGLSFRVEHDSRPAAGKETTEALLVATVELVL